MSGPSARRLPRDFCAGVELARASVATLAATSTGSESRARAAEALNAIADALAVHEGAWAVRDQIATIRFEADSLHRAGTFDGARAVKLGLSRLVEIMARMFDGDRVRPWLDASREAVVAIDRGFVTFERAAIQDAFRQIVDTLTVAGRSEADCLG